MKENSLVDSRILKRVIVRLAVGTLAVLAVGCGSQETDESAHGDGPAASPAVRPAPSSDAQDTRDPSGDDYDLSSVTSIVENGKRYEVKKILSKDAIRAIFDPNFFTPEEATNQYRDTDLVIGVSIGDQHRAYNVAYLSGREIVNDVVGGRPIAVTW